MRVQPDSPRRTDEQRSYFPDWTPCLPSVSEELEAEHNAYLAGGYAEEFGYLAQAGASRGVPIVDGEPPEECAEWRCAAAAMHPGYPITPYPFARHPDQTRRDFVTLAGERSSHIKARVGSRREFVRVADRPYERERHRTLRRAAAMLTRLLATFVALRWELRHRRVR